jgi:deoxycytidylate deaminase
VPLTGESSSMEFDTSIIHAVYLKQCYAHAVSKCVGHSTQCSTILLNPGIGVMLSAPAISENEWYNTTAIQNLAYKAAERGVTTYKHTIYSPLCPTLSDVIALREMSISRVVFHKEFMDKYNERWETEYQLVIDFLSQNDVDVISWSGQVSKKKLGVLVLGNSFDP